MDREFSTEKSGPEDRNGAAPARAGNGLSSDPRGAVRNGNGHGAVAGNGSAHANGHGSAHTNGNGSAHERLSPSYTATGASAVVRPVPGGEHKGMLKLIDFTQPANGTVARNADQTLTFRPNPGFTGKDSFDYTLRDEAGTEFSATVAVAVTFDVPAVKSAAALAPSSRTPGPLSAPPPASNGEGLPRNDGGPALYPGE